MSSNFNGAYNPDYLKLLPRYQKIRDCINDDVVPDGYAECFDGTNVAVAKQPYLVRTPGMSDTTYNALKQLGRFLNVTGATLEAMLGGVWRVEPTIELPESMEYMNENADGEGNSLKSLMRDQVADTLSMGRFGLLVEPPEQRLDNNGNPVETSRTDMQNGTVTTKIKPYTPESVLDWDTSIVNGVRKLSFVKLQEKIVTRSTENFQVDCEYIYRFLVLDNDGYYQQVFDTQDGTGSRGEPLYIKGYDGNVLDYIPFFFSGSRNNDSSSDNPPFYKLSDANIAHYNNDANNRLNLLLHATGTLIVTGTNSDLQGKEIALGGGNGLYLGETGSANLLQLQAGTALPEAIKADLENMVLLGAKLNAPDVQRTFGEAALSASQETALLSDVVSNCEESMIDAINAAILIQTGAEADFELSINRQFFPVPMSAQDRAQWVMEIQQGLSSKFEFWAAKRKAGITTKTDEQIVKEVESSEPPLNFNEVDNADQSDAE